MSRPRNPQASYKRGPHLRAGHGLRGIATLASVTAGALAALALSVAPANAATSTGGGPHAHGLWTPKEAAASNAHSAIPHPEQDTLGSTIPHHVRHTWAKRGSGIRTMAASVQGVDVASYQGNVNWSAAKSDGIDFVYAKATEGTTYVNPYFYNQYVGPYNQGMIRGAYHFALPDNSSGAAQARYFVNNGGGWSSDGQTLPPMLDIEYNPYGGTCYGLSDGQMVNWIQDFVGTVKSMTGKYPTIYSTTNWWSQCTGNYGGFGDTDPLFIANYGSDAYPLPHGWGAWTFWQYTSRGSVAGISGNVDRDVFNGSYDRLVALATCTSENPC